MNTALRLFRRRCAVGAVIALLSPGVAAGPDGFGIENETEYARFLDAVRATEYIRETMIVGGDLIGSITAMGEDPSTDSIPPRLVATVAAGMAFVERNPHIDDFDLFIFLSTTSVVFREAFPTDPDLTVPEHLIAALRFHRVETGVGDDSGPLSGYDTDVGERALELLGISLPGVFDVDSLEEHAIAIERAANVNLVSSSEFGILLVRAYMNQNPDGSDAPIDIADTIDSFLLQRGVEAIVGAQRFDMDAINDAIDDLPTYAEYVAELNDPAGPLDPTLCGGDILDCIAENALQQRLRDAVYQAVDIGGNIIGEFGAPATVEQSLALTPAQIQLIEDERVADMRRSSGSRTSMLANAALLFDNTDAAPYIERQLDLGSAVVGANTRWASVKAGMQTYAGFVSAGTSLVQGDVAGWVSGISDSIFSVFDIVEANASNGVTTDDIYEQTQEIRLQLQEVQTQLNERFDAIDEKLDVIFTTMVGAFDEILDGQGNILEEVTEQTSLILQQASTLNRLEDTLGAYARDQLAQEFENDVNTYLSARGLLDIPYAVFEQGAAGYFTFGANTSTGAAFVGDAGSPFALVDADQVLGGDSVSSRLVELVANAGLFTATPGYDPAGLSGPEPWSAGAAAYTELVSQSPWYFSAFYAAQEASQPVTQADRFIERGERLLGFIDWCRQTGEFGLEDQGGAPITESHLMAGLISYYDGAAQALQNAIDDCVVEYLSPGGGVDYALAMPDGSMLDLWPEDAFVDPGPYVPALTKITTGWGDASDDLSFGSNAPAFDGFAIFSPNASGQETEDQRTLAAMLRTRMLAQAVPDDLVESLPRVHWFMNRLSVDDTLWEMNIALSDVAGSTSSPQVARREIQYFYERYEEENIFEPERWEIVRYGSVNLAAILMKTVWPLGLRDMVASGARIPVDQTIEFIDQGGGGLYRIRFVSDEVVLVRNRPQLEQDAEAFYHGLRSDARAEIIGEFLDPGSEIHTAARSLDDAEALIDAYASVAFSGVFESSEIARAALRGAPPSPANGYEGSPFGIRAADAEELLFLFDEADADPSVSGNPEYDFAELASSNLMARSDLIRREFAAEVTEPRRTSPTIAWTLESLRAMRRDASVLASDDQYATQTDGLVRSVLDNDTRQLMSIVPGGEGVVFNDRPIEVDLDFSHPDGGGSSQNTALGRVEFMPDGTFDFTPNPGAEGVDYFIYRARCDIGVTDAGGGPIYAVSDPVTVRVAVTPAPCPPDLADPFGLLDFNDVIAFLTAFGAGDPAADLAPPEGVYNFNDVIEFLTQFSQGCP